MEKRNVEIPKRLYDKIEKHVKNSDEFSNVEEYITFILEEVLKEEEVEELEESRFDEGDEEAVKERLRGLGYL